MNGSSAVRVLLVVVALLLGIVVAQVGGILAFVGGATIASALAAGGVAFGATVTLTLVVQKSLGLL